MLSVPPFQSQANQSLLPIGCWGTQRGPLVEPESLRRRDTFESSPEDDTINAMRDLARQMGRLQASNAAAHNASERHTQHQSVQEAQPKSELKSGQKTQEATEAAPVDPKHMSEAQKYEYYQAMIEENGGKFASKPGQRNLLSLRHNTNTHANHSQGRYDDTTIMLWTDKHGGKHVRQYHSNTEPSARFEGEYGTDANHDGRLDQVRMKAGYNEYFLSSSDRLGDVLRPARPTRGEIDVNHDGRFNKADGKHRFSHGDYSMLFHAGGETSTGSAGCQTMPPEEFSRFWRDLKNGGDQGHIGYTIVDLPN